MDKREKMRNRFRLDKWYGRVVFVTLAYLLFGWIFYGLWFLLPVDFFTNVILKEKVKGQYYMYIIAPILSFFVPYYIRRFMTFKRRYLYPLHIVIVTLYIFSSYLLATMVVYKNYTFIFRS